MPDALSHVSTRRTDQGRQADPRQVPNSAGGWTFTVSRANRLHRFLTLGTEGGTYYAREKNVTTANAAVVLEWARGDAAALVQEVVKISKAGRAPRNNPALFALAAAAGLGDDRGRQMALDAIPLVARTGTHLFTFLNYVQHFRGWGRGLRRGVSGWYLDKTAGDLAYQVVKYRQREDWTHRDVLRKAHPEGTGAHAELFSWLCGRTAVLADVPLVWAFIKAQEATTVPAWVKLIGDNPSLSWEMLPDAALKEKAVWMALINNGMPMTALMRQLPRLTRLGVLEPASAMTTAVANQLMNGDRLRKARVHPVNILVALRTYAAGYSMRGNATWTPVAKITDALDAAFYLSFGTVEPAGKRTLLALDVSGSMVSPASGLPISCREVSAALALVTAATEPLTTIVGFTSGARGYHSWNWRDNTALTPLNISPRQRLDDAIGAVSNLDFGGTDCSLPMTWALASKFEVDHISVYTDNETWAGKVHPHQALRAYREQMGIPVRLSVVGMTATDFTIADPADPGSLDVAGFDSSVPQLLASFARGDV
jgi:60 kDa SS-A/Ro ribonucleoprotein